MPAKKDKTKYYGLQLIADRFSDKHMPKKYIQRNSITEYTGISMLGEILENQNKQIFNAKEQTNENTVEERYGSLVNNINYDLSIPPRIPYNSVRVGEYKEVENFVFNRWKYVNKNKIFEKNIELWRQFWITCERSDTIVQIVDARNVEFFINKDIIQMYPTKNHVIFCNKSDLISEEQKRVIMSMERTKLHLYSTTDSKFEYELYGTVGLIGYPNVGKSSTVNLILQQKKVRVSATPGKTKHIQTIETDKFILLDCPGLVFPKHNKVELALNGILNVDQLPELDKYEKQIVEAISEEKIRRFYKLRKEDSDVIRAMSDEKGILKSKCLKLLVKQYAAGLMCYLT